MREVAPPNAYLSPLKSRSRPQDNEAEAADAAAMPMEDLEKEDASSFAGLARQRGETLGPISRAMQKGPKQQMQTFQI